MKFRLPENFNDNLAVAVIGMSGRFPGARNLQEFWENLKNGNESITFFTPEELSDAGVPPELLSQPNYIKAAPVLDDIASFDAGFFGYTPREAAILDPQQRIFLECAWSALEDAGYDPEAYRGLIGVFAGSSMNQYLLCNLLAGRKIGSLGDLFQFVIGNDKDYLTTRVSYKLNLRGPSVAVQTACSTSLVAVHMACQNLVSYQCDIALAGGVTLRVPQKAGYCYQDDMIFSPDGHCRPFDAKAGGTIFGSGVGLVVLKRLADAIEDGDRIDAIIRGSAINNDGSGKIGYTAPGLESQAEVIAAAQAIAGVAPDTIAALEAHGTGTQLGDPIEVAALNRVFTAGTDKKNYCALGSVKSNVGHLEAAAGVAGLIKMSLALRHKILPPSLHFEDPNPQIDFANSPFFVNTTAREWSANGVPRRAGVSSFGMGGTNAHAILEEAPVLAAAGPSRPWQLLLLSAKTARALDTATANFVTRLKNANDFPDIAYTLKVGRQPLRFRRMLVAQNAADAVAALESADPRRVFTYAQNSKNRAVTFMFPGQGTQYPNMGRELYDNEPTFRHWIDAGSALLAPFLGLDLRKLLYPAEDEVDAAAQQLGQTAITQPALFVTEYAMAILLAEWGIRPQNMIGHSIGEYVAACLAGVFSFEQALTVVAVRGKLIGSLPAGSMISVPLPPPELEILLNDQLSLAAINAPSLCTVSGTHEAVAELEQRLASLGIQYSRLHTSHAFHSAMMDPILPQFREKVSSVQLRPPQVPFVSNLSGTWISAEQATDPDYWVEHLRHTVQFSSGILEIFKRDSQQALLEIGPGQTLSTLSRQHTDAATPRFIYSSMRHPHDRQSDTETLLMALGRLWLCGVRPDWNGFYTHELRRRVEMPTYPFERRRFWVEPEQSSDQWARMETISVSTDTSAEPEGSAWDSQVSYVAPRNELEETIAGIWRKFLGIDRISIHGNFFELNGHSLVATQVLAQIGNVLNAKVSLRRMLENPTIAGLAEAVREAQASPAPVEEPTAELPQVLPDRAQRFQSFPLTEMQQAQWIGRLGGFNMGDVAAHVYFETEGEGLDVARIADTWQQLVDRHDMLRAVVHADGQQQILENVPRYEMKVLDLRGKSADAVQTEIMAVRERMSHQVRPADQWPLFEVCATQLDGSKVRMHLSFDLLVSDIGSIRILMSEWSKLYQRQDLPLPELEITFRDYVLTEARLKDTEAHERALQYWRQRIAKLPSAPELPMTQNIATVTKPKFFRLHCYLEHEVWNKLKTRAAHARISPSAIVLSAFGQVLAQWSKTPRFCINGTILNRWPLHAQVRKLVGEFASFAPVEMDFATDTPFEEFARQVQIQSWESLEHRYVSGVRILREIARARGGTSGGTLPVVFTSTLVAAAREEYFPTSWLGNMDYLISQTPQVWFDHSVFEEEKGLLLNWIVADGVYPAGMVEEMFGAYEKLLRKLAGEPELWQRSTRELQRMLLPEKQQEQRRAVNATEAPLPQGWLHSGFVEQVRQRGQQEAVITPTRRMSYEELFQRSNRLAHRLRREGVKPNTLVAVAMEKGWEQVVGVLGVVTAGAAYLPVGPSLPQERIEYLLEHGEVKVVLTQAEGKEKRWIKPGLCQIEVGEVGQEEEEGSWLEPVQKPSDLAYVIYTSGSTGWPKGVMMSHQATLNTIVDVNRRFGIGGGDRVFGLSSLSFDLSVYDVFGTLAAGGTLVLPRSGSMRDPAHWAEVMEREQVTVWNSVPALMEMLVEYGSGRGVKVPLRVVMLSGDWIGVSLPGRLRQWLGEDVRLISMGGATEAAIWSIVYEIGEVEAGWESIPYGKAMANQKFHVLNEGLEPCPVWVAGELYIGGVGLAQGYWRDEEKSRSRFLEHPRTGERLYRTGDLGRYLPDGNIEFLGREDFQVKVHGHRIELGEIEAALAQHPLVRTAVVTAQGKDRAHRRLVGYVVPAGKEDKPDVAELREFIGAKLPDYMVPPDILVLEELPLSANGKVDRKALPSPDAAAEPNVTVQGSATLAEKLKTIFASVLGIPDAGIHTNFFEMGGDSILGIQIINRAREQGIEITPQQIFEHQTIAELATVVRTISDMSCASGLIMGKVPLTQFQRWILQGISAPAQASQVLTLQASSLNIALLEQAFLQVQRHHDALRLRFHKSNGEWQQTHAEEHQLIKMVRLNSSSAVNHAIEELRANLDVSNAPLAMGCVEREQPLIIWLMHELLADQLSWKILLQDMETAYEQLSRNEAVKLPPKRASFKQWAERMQHPVSSLSGPPVQSPLATLSAFLDAEQSRALLGQVLLIYNIKPGEALITALAQTLASQLSLSGLCLDIETDGRSLSPEGLDFTRVVGCFTTLSSAELSLKDIHDCDAALKSIKEQLRGKQSSISGKSQVLFSYFDSAESELSKLNYFSQPDGGPARIGTVFPHPLQLSCSMRRGCLEMQWIFDEQKHSRSAVQKLSDVFYDNLQNLIRHCTSSNGNTYSPSDFPDAEVNQEELDKFLDLLGKSTGGGL